MHQLEVEYANVGNDGSGSSEGAIYSEPAEPPLYVHPPPPGHGSVCSLPARLPARLPVPLSLLCDFLLHPPPPPPPAGPRGGPRGP